MITPNVAESIFLAALEKPDATARLAYLEEACKEDSDLRHRVERLLEAHAQAGNFLEQPIVGHPAEVSSTDTTNADSGAKGQENLDETQAEGTVDGLIDDQLAFLAPSQKPGALGRIDHYEVLEIVGKGGFGTVLKAFDEKLHRVVAIKTLASELAASSPARQRFIREARTAAAVSHEHVVTIHAVVEEHRPPYLVMQMIDGMTLQQKLDKAGTLSLREILRIGMQMADGLAAAHRQGLVHRDIKPANILLENGIERVKITDFGLARAVDDASVTQSGVVAGTPMYMSPEQAEGLPIDHRSDLFSLGTVLYAMCTGHPPFRASSTMAVLKRVTDASPRPIREINSEIPDWLCDIIGKLHAKRPEDRFQTAKEVEEILGQRLSDVQAGRATKVPSRVRDGAIARSTPSGLWPQPRFGLSRRMYWTIVGVLASCFAVILASEALRWFADATFAVVSDDPESQVVITDAHGNVVVDLKGSAAWGETLRPATYALALRPGPGRKFEALAWAGSAKKTFKETRTLSDGREEHHFEVTFERGKRLLADIKTSARPAPVVEPGWAQLFNGKDLSQWENPEPEKWQVKDSILTGKGATLFAKNLYRDFHLCATLRHNEESHAAISFRSGAGRSQSVQLGSTNPGDIGFHATGKTEYPFKGRSGLTLPNTWFNLDLIVQGQKVTVKINGERCAEGVLDGMPETGKIALNAFKPETGFIEYRKIEIKELPPEEPGWVQLFDGKELTDWHPSDKWRVKNGILAGNGPGFLSSKKSYGNFHLRMKAKFNSKAQGSLSFRGKSSETHGEIALGNQHKLGMKTGSLHFFSKAKSEWVIKQDQELVAKESWFELDLMVRGKHMIAKVDGVTTADVTLDHLLESGLISLNAYEAGTVLEFSKIEIKELPPEEPGWVQLFDGKSAKGWTMTPPDSWSIEKGLLVNEGKSHIWFRMAEYRDVHLRVEYQADADSHGLVGVRRKGKASVAGVTLGSLGDNSKDGSLFQIDYSGKSKIHVQSTMDVKPNTWAVAEVIVRDHVMTVFIDGKETGRHFFNDLPDEGKVGLEVFKGTIRVRKMEIKELPTPSFALSFDGIDDHVAIPFWTYDGKDPITMEAWVRVPKVPDRQMTIIGNNVGLGVGLSKEGRWFGSIRDLAGALNPVNSHCFSDHLCESGRFTHVALVLVGRTGTLYVDGRAQKRRAELGADHVPSPDLFFIGARRLPKDVADYPFLGAVSAVRISKIARYDRDFTPDKTFMTDSDTLALYKFKQGHDDLLFDSSGLERHGEIVGAKWINIDDNRPPVGEWASYFNGKDLTGWRMLSPGKGDWQVRDGLLLGHSTEGGKYLFSNRPDWGSFHLRMEAKLKGAGEILYHIHHNQWNGGLRVVHYGKADGLHGSIRSSMDPGWHPSINKVAFPKDDWFILEVIADGPRLITKANGEVTAEVTLTPEQQKKWYKEGVISIGCGSKGEWTIRKIEIKELPPIGAAPFVILAKDKRAETQHATLADAVKAAQSGDTIEIRGDGPFETEPIVLGKKALAIRAGAGFRPHLKYQPTDPESTEPLLLTQGPLVLEGLTLERGANPGGKLRLDGTAVVRVDGAPARFAGCRLIGRKLHRPLVLVRIPEGVVTNCEILGDEDCYGGIEYASPVSSRLHLENNLVVSPRVGLTTSFGRADAIANLEYATVSLRGNTIRARISINYHSTPLKPAQLIDLKKARLHVEASGNIFSGDIASGSLIFDESTALQDAIPLLPKLMSFQDEDNLYEVGANTFLQLTRAGGKDPFPAIKNLQEWHKLWGIAKSRSQVGTPAFEGGGDLVAKALSAPDTVSPADFRLAKDSPGKGAGPGGKDLGADMDLIGPGAAYEKWKTTKEYDEWRKEADALVAVAPPFAGRLKSRPAFSE